MLCAPLRLEPKPSRRLIAFAGVVHCAALIVLIPLYLPLWIFLLLAVLIFSSAWRTLMRLLFRDARAVRVLTWESDDHWLAVTANGQEIPLDLIGSYAHPWLLTLCFRRSVDRKKFCLAFERDSLPEKDLHALRMRLMSR